MLASGLAMVAACSGGGGDDAGTTTTAVVTTSTTTVATSGLAPGDEALVAAPVRAALADEVVYFVVTDRFDNGDPANDRGGSTVDDPLVHGFLPDHKGFHHGGDLAGLRRRLDYLEGLGVTALWITPPFTNRWVQGDGTVPGSSSSYHGYWQVDLTTVDPHLGTADEMRALVDDAHARGMKVFFDAVLNHTGDVIGFGGPVGYVPTTTVPFRDAGGQPFDPRAVAGSEAFPALDATTSFPYVPTFATPAEATLKAPDFLDDPTLYHNRGNSTFNGESSEYGDFFGLDDLFTEHPAVVQGMIDVYADAVRTYRIDGFRVDTVKHVNDAFWQAWVPAMLATAQAEGIEEFSIFGEVFDETPGFLSRFSTELAFPGTLDFRLDAAVRDVVAGSKSTDRLARVLDDDDWFLDADSNAFGLATFAGNHDIGRLGWSIRQLNSTAADAELVARVRLGYAVLFASRGAPVVYYGDEQGFTGDGRDQDARQDLFGSQVPSYNDDDLIGTGATTAEPRFDPGHPLYAAIAELSALRRDQVALRRGAQLVRATSAEAGVFAFSRVDREEQVEVVVVLNTAEEPRTATFPTDTPSATFTPLLGGDDAVTSDAAGSVSVAVPALDVLVLRADRPVGRDAEADVAGISVDAEVSGRARVRVDVADAAWHEVTFTASVAGGPFAILGTDDAWPYSIRHDVSAIAPGTAVTYKVIARDAAGNLSAATAEATVVAGP